MYGGRADVGPWAPKLHPLGRQRATVRRPPGPVITMELTWMSVQPPPPLQSNATAVARLEVPLRLLYVTLLIATATCNANPEEFS